MPIGFFCLFSTFPRTWFDGCAHHRGCGLVVCLLLPGQLRNVLFSALALAMFSNAAQMAWPCDCVWSSCFQVSASSVHLQCLFFFPLCHSLRHMQCFARCRPICQYILHIFCSCQLACVLFGLQLRQFPSSNFMPLYSRPHGVPRLHEPVHYRLQHNFGCRRSQLRIPLPSLHTYGTGG